MGLAVEIRAPNWEVEMSASPGADSMPEVSPTLHGDTFHDRSPNSRDPDRPERYRANHWWQKGEQAEYRKLMAHIFVLRKRARQLLDADSGAWAAMVRNTLSDRSWTCVEKTDKDTNESAHEYADALEELIPLIANEAYINAVWQYELAQSKESEDVTLTSLFNSSIPTEPDKENAMIGTLESPVIGNSAVMAQALRLLVQKRADRMRHVRLMNRLRRFYFLRLAGLIVAILILVIFAVIWQTPDGNPASSTIWEILMAFGLGALGGTLSSTLKIRDIGELSSFRNVATFLWMQTLVGASFGFVAWLILFSGIVVVGSSDTSWGIRAVVAFVAGYSEPFVLGVLNKVMGLSR
jgi:hypothetical protein